MLAVNGMNQEMYLSPVAAKLAFCQNVSLLINCLIIAPLWGGFLNKSPRRLMKEIRYKSLKDNLRAVQYLRPENLFHGSLQQQGDTKNLKTKNILNVRYQETVQIAIFFS